MSLRRFCWSKPDAASPRSTERRLAPSAGIEIRQIGGGHRGRIAAHMPRPTLIHAPLNTRDAQSGRPTGRWRKLAKPAPIAAARGCPEQRLKRDEKKALGRSRATQREMAADENLRQARCSASSKRRWWCHAGLSTKGGTCRHADPVHLGLPMGRADIW